MQIKGQITRLVAGTRRDRSDERVFIRPSDPTVLQKLDGEQYVASGEIPVYAKVDDLEIGQEYSIDIPVGKE